MFKKLLAINYHTLEQSGTLSQAINNVHSQVNIPIIEINIDGIIKIINKDAEDITGYSKAQVIDQSIFTIIHEEDMSEFLRELSTIQIGTMGVYQSTFIHKNSDSYSFNAHVIPREEGNTVVGWQMTIFDVRLVSELHDINHILFTHVVESFNLTVWSFDFQRKRLLYTSPYIEDIFGRTKKEIYQTPIDIWYQSIHPEDRERVLYYNRKLVEGEQTTQHFRLVRPDGTIKWVETHTAPYLNKRDEVQYLYGIITDVTEEKETEQQLVEKSQIYQSFFESNTDAVMIFDTKGQFIDVNEAFSTLSGYTLSDLKGTFTPLVHPKDIHWVWKTFNKSVQGEQTSFSLDVVRKDGMRIKVSIINQPIMIDGKITGIFALAKDLTDLNESEEKYRTVVENALVGCWIVQDNMIQFMNAYLQDKLAVHTTHKAMSHHPFIFRQDRDLVNEKTQQLLSNDLKNAVYTYRMVTSESKLIYVEACGTVINYKGAPAILETILDITERKVMEDNMLNKERQLELSERRHKALVESAYDAISIRDEHGYITYTSPAFETLFGYTYDTYKSIQDSNFVHPNDVDMIKSKFKECLSETSKKIRCEARFKHINGNWVFVEIIMTNKLDDPSIKGIVFNYRDVTERVEARERIRNLAFYDSITNTPNRRYFEEALQREINVAKEKGSQLSLMFLDLDRFKYVNDTIGHRIGDLLLKEVAERLLASLDSTGLLARLGGDEFVILLSNSSIDKVKLIAQRVLKEFDQTFIIENYNLNMTVSIGISLYPDSGEDADSLMRCADMAMYQAKEQGKNQYYIYTPYMNAVALKSFTLSNDLNKSIAMDQLYLMYQPIVSTVTQEMVSVEALLRWNHPTWGDVSPNEFVALAEESGFITEIGDWVLFEACRQLKQWHDSGYSFLNVSINFSTLQFLERDFIDKIVHTFVKTGFNPKWLTIEITENTLLKNDEHVMRTIRQLKEMGIRFAIDDFGTGYSSLSYLKNYRMDILKIDKSFIDDIAIEKESFEIVSTVVDLAKKLHMDIVVEGIETMDQLEKIKSMSCEKVQGFLYSKPLLVNEMEEILSKGPHLSCQLHNHRESLKKNSRNYSRIIFDHPVEADMAISRLGGKTVSVGTTKILIEDIGAGGLKFSSNVSFSTKSDMILSFCLTLFDTTLNCKGQIIWKQDIDEGIYQYGIDFVTDNTERILLSEKLEDIYHYLQTDHNGSGNYFVREGITNYFTHVTY